VLLCRLSILAILLLPKWQVSGMTSFLAAATP
jgi:hypothetical protein